MTFVDRILLLISEKGISKNKFLTEIGFNHNSFINWKKQMPGSEVVVKAAKYFGVTTDYLLGVNKDAPVGTSEGDENLKSECLRLFMKLSEDRKNLILRNMEFLAGQEGSDK